MSIEKLFTVFDEYQNLWININDIRDQIIDIGIQDEINFHFVKMDNSIVRGFLHRYVHRGGVYAEPEWISDIYIADDLDENWKRVVAAKELLHILDTKVTTAESKAAVDFLINNLSLPPEVRSDTNSSFNDRFRLILAIAILVPLECRKILRRLYADGKITQQEISNFAKIPMRFSDMILDVAFDEIVVAICQHENGIDEQTDN